jgi:hypothetical protein
VNPDSNQNRIAFGYFREGKHSIILHAGQAAAVALIFQYYSEGRSIASIKETLEDIGIPSPLNGKTWGKQTIANILSNPNYLGNENYPTIISKELFETAQRLKKDNIGNNGYTNSTSNSATRKQEDNFTSTQAPTAASTETTSS